MRFIIKEGVKDFFRENEMRVSVDFYEALDAEVETLLLKAVERAKKNGRTTVMKNDL